MSSVYGDKLKISIFGQSHGEGIGVVIDGLPAGMEIDLVKLKRFTDRRKPGKNRLETQRKEEDETKILSGIINGITCGAPLCAVIENRDIKSKDYDFQADIVRPSHADYTAFLKYSGHSDIRGGGHFSGRLTAPLCIAGGIAIQILQKYGIEVRTRIAELAGVKDMVIDSANINSEVFDLIKDRYLPVFDSGAMAEMEHKIEEARNDRDSVGGVVECFILGMPGGMGNPMFGGVENKIASAVFGIPGVRGVEFGNGFQGCRLKGSENNDEFRISDGQVKTRTNNSGGIQGGISNGMPIVVRVAFKPTASIGKLQNTISLKKMENTVLELKGRHDPCIVPRAVPCVEAAAAIAVLDIIMEDGFIK